jgi:hypothetical protein
MNAPAGTASPRGTAEHLGLSAIGVLSVLLGVLAVLLAVR